ncbi:MAG: hypothetical protein WCT05_14910, partial [Lentisphaeria bacterium]
MLKPSLGKVTPQNRVARRCTTEKTRQYLCRSAGSRLRPPGTGAGAGPELEAPATFRGESGSGSGSGAGSSG